MSPQRRESKGYFEDLLEGCERIARYTTGVSHEHFLADSLVQDATVRNLEIMGEASRQLHDLRPDAFDRFATIPFKKMYALRNHLAHGYLTVDMEIVWKVVKQEIPELKDLLIEVLNNWPPDLT